MTNIFDEINTNTRNSVLLVLGVVVLLFILLSLVSFYFDLGLEGAVVGFILSLIYVVAAYFFGSRIVLTVAGAREMKKQEHPYLYNLVEGLSMAASIPMPKIYIIEERAPNAFATGTSPDKASVAVTRGLLEMMNREELEGVISHEISHIKNYDIRFMLLTVVLINAVSIIANIGLRMFFYTGPSERRMNGRGGLFFLIALIVLILAPLFALLVRFAISREREYLADASGAQLTRYPDGLANALEKLGKSDMRMRDNNAALSSLYFAEPLTGGLAGLFSTHPPIKERVKRLRSM